MNFRIHKSTDTNISDRFVALVGKNDVGKSSVLEAVDILCDSEKNIADDDITKDSTGSANIICTFDGRILDYSSPTINEDRNAVNTHFYKFGIDDNNHFIDLNQDLNTLENQWNNNCQWFIESTYPHHFERKKLEDLLNTFLYLHQLYSITTSLNIKVLIDKFLNEKRDLQKIISQKNFLLANCGNSDELNIVNNLFNILSQFETDIKTVLQCNNLTNKAKELIRQFKESGDSNLIKKISEQVVVEDEKNSDFVQSLVNEPNYIAWVADESASPVIDSSWHSFKDKIDNTFLNGGIQINNIPFFDEPEYNVWGDLLLNGSLSNISSKADDILAQFDQYANSENEKDIVFLWEKYLDSFGSNDIKLAKRGSGFKRLCEIYAFTMSILGNFPINGGSTILAVEEPEISLHPSQQRDIVKRLKDILNLPNTQVIISTHSPYIVNELDTKSITVLKRRKDNANEIDPNPLQDRLFKKPLLCEINYLAFEEASYDYHVALFGLMINLINDKFGSCDVEHIDSKCLENEPFKSLTSFHTYFRTGKDENVIVRKPAETDLLERYVNHQHSLQYCVRNYIDHPHDMNREFGDMKMVDTSIKQMFKIIAELKKLPDLS